MMDSSNNNLLQPASPSNIQHHNNPNNNRNWRFLVLVCSVITFSAGVGAGLTLRSFYTSINQEQYGVSCNKQQQQQQQHQQKNVFESSSNNKKKNNNIDNNDDMLQMMMVQQSTPRENLSVSVVEQEWQSTTMGSNSVVKKGRDDWSDPSNNNINGNGSSNNNNKNNTAKEDSITTTTTTTTPTETTTSAWCPTATCPNSDLCHPCKRRFLILIASGRSASTTLTYMLDSLPGVRMSGENNDTLKAIRRMINNVALSENFIRGTNKKNAWGHNKIPNGAFACVAQHMMETINPPATDEHGKLLQHVLHDNNDNGVVVDKDDDSETIVGFKTIRLLEHLEQGEKLEELVQWIQENFPCARIVVNIRSNVQEQVESWKKSLGVNTDLDELQAKNELFRKTANLFGKKQAYFLDSSDWLRDISHLNQLVKWLGFNEACFFDELLEFNTKGSGYKAGRTETHHNPNCRYIGGSDSGAGGGSGGD